MTTFNIMREKFIGELDALDPEEFADLIADFENIKAPNNLSKIEAEMYCKVKLLYLTAKSLSEEYFNRQDDYGKIKLISLFKDEFGEEQEVLEQMGIEVDPEVFDSNFKSVKRMGTRLKKLLNKLEGKSKLDEEKEHFRPLTPVKEVRKSKSYFDKMDIDVDMDEYEAVLLDEKTVIGTTGLACCGAIIVIGQNAKGQYHACVGHYSTPSVADIKEQRRFMLTELKIRRNTIKTTFIGGCIGSLASHCNLATKADELVDQMYVGLADIEFMEGTNIAVRLKHGRPIINYATISEDPVIEDIKYSSHEDIFCPKEDADMSDTVCEDEKKHDQSDDVDMLDVSKTNQKDESKQQLPKLLSSSSSGFHSVHASVKKSLEFSSSSAGLGLPPAGAKIAKIKPFQQASNLSNLGFTAIHERSEQSPELPAAQSSSRVGSSLIVPRIDGVNLFKTPSPHKQSTKLCERKVKTSVRKLFSQDIPSAPKKRKENPVDSSSADDHAALLIAFSQADQFQNSSLLKTADRPVAKKARMS